MMYSNFLYGPCVVVVLVGILLSTRTTMCGDAEVGDDSPPPPDDRYNATVSLIVDLSSSSTTDDADFKTGLKQLLDGRSIDFSLATIPANTSIYGRQIKVFSPSSSSESDSDSSSSINIVLDDVTSADIQFAAANTIDSTITNRSNATVTTMMIDICAAVGANDTSVAEQILSAVEGNAYGFLVRPITNATGDDDEYAAYNISDFLAADRTYVLKLANASQEIYLNLTRSLCRNYGAEIIEENVNTSSAICCCSCGDQGPGNNLTTCPNDDNMENCTDQNAAECCASTTNLTDEITAVSDEDSSSAITQEVSSSSETEEEANNTTTRPISILARIESIDYNRKSSSASVAIVIVFLLIASTLVCIAYRKRIMAYVKSKTNKQQTDNQITAIRYGTLMNRDEYDIRGF